MESGAIISIFDSIPVWIMVLPIFICSVLLFAVFLERLLFFKKIDQNYRLIISGNDSEIRQKCLSGTGPLVNLIIAVINGRENSQDIGSFARNEALIAVNQVEKYGAVVSTIATVSPMFGLLGTVTGMMKSFSALSVVEKGTRELLAGGITEALITTALGLMVGIPAIIFYNYLVARSSFFVKEIEYIVNNLTGEY